MPISTWVTQSLIKSSSGCCVVHTSGIGIMKFLNQNLGDSAENVVHPVLQACIRCNSQPALLHPTSGEVRSFSACIFYSLKDSGLKRGSSCPLGGQMPAHIPESSHPCRIRSAQNSCHVVKISYCWSNLENTSRSPPSHSAQCQI